MRLFLVLIALVFGGTAHASESDGIVQKVFPGCTKTRCYIGENLGGDVYAFEDAAAIMGREKYHVMIGGPLCVSACVVAADTLRKNGADVCILPSVTFYLHKATWFMAAADGSLTPSQHFDPPQSPEIKRYVKKRGGFPISRDLRTMLRMPVEDAARFWRICGPRDLR